MRYPVNIEVCEHGSYLVSFPDIPEAIAQGRSREEALDNAQIELVKALGAYFESENKVLKPGSITGDYIVLPASTEANLLMLEVFIDSGLTQTELAKRMGVKKQEITRVFNLGHTTKIDTIQNAFVSMDVGFSNRVEFIDVYSVKDGCGSLVSMWPKGKEIRFIGLPAGSSKVALYSATIVQDEHEGASFVVVQNIVRLSNISPDMDKVSALSWTLSDRCAALPLTCILLES
ncbi:type II toxin-antitoxin system HicB family antitoxin [Tatumella punctata]|uniref:Type II toxin-antitoxin system HicB family antitoxin n=1 Tax=Tatumella punctata TaxID=399969 RepID=A0ABW1VUN0_9GAMM